MAEDQEQPGSTSQDCHLQPVSVPLALALECRCQWMQPAWSHSTPKAPLNPKSPETLPPLCLWELRYPPWVSHHPMTLAQRRAHFFQA